MSPAVRRCIHLKVRNQPFLNHKWLRHSYILLMTEIKMQQTAQQFCRKRIIRVLRFQAVGSSFNEILFVISLYLETKILSDISVQS